MYFVVSFIEQLESHDLELPEVLSLIRLMEAIRSMMGFSKLSEDEKKHFNVVFGRILNRATNLSSSPSGLPTQQSVDLSAEQPALPDHSSAESSTEDEVVPENDSLYYNDNKLHWIQFKDVMNKVLHSSLLINTGKAMLCLLATAILAFNIFILVALLHSSDLPEKNPLCQPTAATGYHIRDWMEESSNKVKVQVWKLNEWWENKRENSQCSCPVCPPCPKVQACKVTCDLKEIQDIIAFRKGKRSLNCKPIDVDREIKRRDNEREEERKRKEEEEEERKRKEEEERKRKEEEEEERKRKEEEEEERKRKEEEEEERKRKEEEEEERKRKEKEEEERKRKEKEEEERKRKEEEEEERKRKEEEEERKRKEEEERREEERKRKEEEERREEERKHREIRNAKLEELLHRQGIELSASQSTLSQLSELNHTQDNSIISCLVNDTILSLYGISQTSLSANDSIAKLLSICIIALVTCECNELI